MNKLKFLFLLFFLQISSISALTFKDGKQINENNLTKNLDSIFIQPNPLDQPITSITKYL